LGNSERSAVSSRLHRMLKHLVKLRIQPERRSRRWIGSITEGRSEIEYKIDHITRPAFAATPKRVIRRFVAEPSATPSPRQDWKSGLRSCGFRLSARGSSASC
jgi:hypothetical protein